MRSQGISRLGVLLFGLFSAAMVLAGPSTYTENVKKQTGALVVAQFNFPGYGTFKAKMATAAGPGYVLQVGTELDVISAKQIKSSYAVPANYDPTSRTLFIPALVYKVKSGWYYYDVTLVAGSGSLDPLGFPSNMVVSSVVETQIGVPSAGAAGADGAAGPQGPAGPQGAVGATGAKGDQGDQGIQGVKGDQGDQGIQGAKGDKGDTGDTGATGAQGAAGPQGVAGAQGEAGPAGVTGPQGSMGPQGAAGTNGAVGATGAQGVAGPEGASGPAGPAGSQGAVGSTGATGPAGPQGSVGADGGVTATYEFHINAANIGGVVLDNNSSGYALPVDFSGQIQSVALIAQTTTTSALTDTLTVQIREVPTNEDGLAADVTCTSGVLVRSLTMDSGVVTGTRYNRTKVDPSVDGVLSTGNGVFACVSDVTGGYSVIDLTARITVLRN